MNEWEDKERKRECVLGLWGTGGWFIQVYSVLSATWAPRKAKKGKVQT